MQLIFLNDKRLNNIALPQGQGKGALKNIGWKQQGQSDAYRPAGALPTGEAGERAEHGIIPLPKAFIHTAV